MKTAFTSAKKPLTRETYNKLERYSGLSKTFTATWEEVKPYLKIKVSTFLEKENK